MTPQESGRLVGYLMSIYGDPPGGEEGFAVFALMLIDCAYDEAQQAAVELVRTRSRGTRWPTPAEVLEVVARRRTGLPTPQRAWAMVNDREAQRHEMPDEVREAAERVGGFYLIRTTDAPHVVRAQFLKAYEDVRDEAMREAMLGDLPPTYVPGLKPFDAIGDKLAAAMPRALEAGT